MTGKLLGLAMLAFIALPALYVAVTSFSGGNPQRGAEQVCDQRALAATGHDFQSARYTETPESIVLFGTVNGAYQRCEVVR